MAQISRQQIDVNGLNPTLVAAASGGDTFENSGKEFLYVENTDASSHDVTVPGQKASFNDSTHGEQDIQDVTVSVPAGEFRLVGPFAPASYNKSDGEADINYSSNTGMQIAVLQLKG